MSERAQKILVWLTSSPSPLFIRQQSLAEQFNCSRRSIGRALNELKAAGLLLDLNKRHENRCKMYEISWLQPKETWIAASPSAPRNDGLSPQAQQLWNLYEKTFRIVFKMPELPTYYAQVTRALEGVTEETELWTKTWAGLWALTDTMPTEKVFDPLRKTWFFRLNSVPL